MQHLQLVEGDVCCHSCSDALSAERNNRKLGWVRYYWDAKERYYVSDNI